MSVLTMTLHQAQRCSFNAMHYDAAAAAASVPTISPAFSSSRGIKRSREHESLVEAQQAGITRTQKRSMGLTEREQLHVAESTFRRLFDAQKQQQQQHSGPLVDSINIVCLDCGRRPCATSGTNVMIKACQGCNRFVCGNCSITVYTDAGDFDGCLECSRC